MSIGTAANYEYASFLRRLCAYFIDYICFNIIGAILFVIFTVIMVIAFNISPEKFVQYEVSQYLLNYVMFVIYSAIFLSIFSWTPGKAILSMKVLTEDYKKVSVQTAILRGMMVPWSMMLLGAGYFSMFKNNKKQSWHDLTLRTIVIYEKNN